MYSCQKASRSLQTSQAGWLPWKRDLPLFEQKISYRLRATNMPLLFWPKEQKNRSLIYAVASPVPPNFPANTLSDRSNESVCDEDHQESWPKPG